MQRDLLFFLLGLLAVIPLNLLTLRVQDWVAGFSQAWTKRRIEKIQKQLAFDPSVRDIIIAVSLRIVILLTILIGVSFHLLPSTPDDLPRVPVMDDLADLMTALDPLMELFIYFASIYIAMSTTVWLQRLGERREKYHAKLKKRLLKLEAKVRTTGNPV